MAISTVTDWNDLPVLLNIRHIIDVMGVSRDTAYNLIYQRGFPAMRVGKQIRVPKDRFRRWLDEQTGEDEEE
jgi:excisionase family DNA binding protein